MAIFRTFSVLFTLWEYFSSTQQLLNNSMLILLQNFRQTLDTQLAAFPITKVSAVCIIGTGTLARRKRTIYRMQVINYNRHGFNLQ